MQRNALAALGLVLSPAAESSAGGGLDIGNVADAAYTACGTAKARAKIGGFSLPGEH